MPDKKTQQILRAQVAWDAQYTNLIAYKNKKGNCLVPRRDPEHKKLGAWVAEQRQRKKHGKLTADRIEKLESLGFAWVAPRAKTRGKSISL